MQIFHVEYLQALHRKVRRFSIVRKPFGWSDSDELDVCGKPQKRLIRDRFESAFKFMRLAREHLLATTKKWHRDLAKIPRPSKASRIDRAS
jgi:hypothetical protein